jgi:hypothetical protein
MKTKIFLLVALVFLTSCSDILVEDPKGVLTGDNAVNTVEGLQSVINGAYRPLQTNFSSGFTFSSMQAVGMGGDDLTTHKASNKSEFREFDQFSVTNLNSRMRYIWKGCYKSIQASNNVINNYKKLSITTKIRNIAGEAHFLRAFNYYWLVRLWGNIPLITTTEYSPEMLSIGKTAPADVYKLIIADLVEAQALLPNIKSDPGRMGKGAAKTLLADVYLTMSGWPLKDASKLSDAVILAKEVMTKKTGYGYDLLPNYADLFTGTSASNATKEEIFAFQCAGSVDYTHGNSMYGQSPQPGDEGGWDDYFPEINFFNSYPSGVRKDVTFYTTFADGTDWTNSITKHPYYKKFIITGKWFTDQSVMMIRYAHTLLILAEASARTATINDNDVFVNADAYNAINLIRTRAGLPTLSGLTKVDFIKAVIDERAWEFAGEGTTRWFDLVRLEMVESVNTNKNTNENVVSIITKDKYYLPIPVADVIANENLK